MNKKMEIGEEKKEDFRGFDCTVLRGSSNDTPPTTPDRHVPTGSAPRGRSRAHLLFAESSVLFRQLNSIINAIKMQILQQSTFFLDR